MKTILYKNCRGFSLLELSVALGLVGLILAASLQIFKIHQEDEASHALQAILPQGIIGVALERFIIQNNRYPCPADASLPETDPNSGVEFCQGQTFNATLQKYEHIIDPDTVTVGTCQAPGNGFCRTTGTRDMDGDGAFDGKDAVLIGSIPYTTLGLSAHDTYDGWGMKFGYAITERLTLTPPGSNALSTTGTITLVDANGLTVPSTYDPIKPPVPGRYAANAHLLILWSYGSSRAGAFTPAGKQPVACGPLPLPVPSAPPPTPLILPINDSYNCDNDATFLYSYSVLPIAGIGNPYPSIRSLQRGPNFYDTMIGLYEVNQCREAWCMAPSVHNSGKPSDPTAFVGIGIADPQYPLDVAGDINVPKTLADSFCDASSATGGNCFKSRLIGGSGFSANDGCSGEAIAGISEGKAKCPDSIPTGLVPEDTCPDGEFANGIDPSTGRLKCVPF